MQMHFVPFGLRHKYPHLSKEDSRVWTTFIAEHPTFFDFVAYDVRVGAGHEPQAQFNDNINRMAKLLTQKRIDVVAVKEHSVYVVEIKPIFSGAAVGQVLLYTRLATRQFNLSQQIFPLIIYESAQLDVPEFAISHSVTALQITPRSAL